MGGNFEENIKNSFFKVKNDMQLISEEVEKLKDKLDEQDLTIKDTLMRLNEIKSEIINAKNKVSTGNEGANQSINQLINQSINHQSTNQSISPPNQVKSLNTAVISGSGVEYKSNHLINQSLINQSTNQSINQSPEKQLKEVTKNINSIFFSLSRQELKLFLTIYQLEDEGQEPTYKGIALKMQLSEHCIRGHLSSLLKKNAPISKKRMNNKTTLLSVSQDFKAFNLKQKLINLYYDSDPHQKTLFDLN